MKKTGYSGKHRPRYMSGGELALSAAWFPCALLYNELLLRAFDGDVRFFSPALLRIVLFSAAAGLLLFLLCDLIPKKGISRFLAGTVSFVFTFVLCVERGIKSMFSVYYGVLAAAGTAGEAVGNFTDSALAAFFNARDNKTEFSAFDIKIGAACDDKLLPLFDCVKQRRIKAHARQHCALVAQRKIHCVS